MLHPKKAMTCGSWPSPISTEIVTGKNILFSELKADQNILYWLERRPEEQNRTVIVQWTEQSGLQDITSHSFSVGTRVHEYGGGSYNVQNKKIVFSDQKTNGIWLISDGDAPICIFQDNHSRFADFILTDNSIICVEEHHEQSHVTNQLVAFSLTAPYEKTILVKGADFYSSPRVSPDQTTLVWIEWDHPYMPWESTRLCLAPLHNTQTISTHHILAGQNIKESLIQPGWSPDNQLFVCSDRSGWWNLYHVDLTSLTNPVLQNIAPMQAEIGLPQWVFGQQSWYAVDQNTIIAQRIINAVAQPILIHKQEITPLNLRYPENCPVPCITEHHFAWINQSPDHPAQIMLQDTRLTTPIILRSASTSSISSDNISYGKPITFQTTNNQQAHAFFYPPKNANYCPIKDELPPLLVLAHGGPTGQTSNGFSPRIQFWTSRGFAVVDVNYRGSTGFGKYYRELLQKQWGILDVQDCIHVCKALIDQGKVDPKRIVIRGSSAGGFTVLTALIQSSLFAAGSCLYGVGDLTALAKETHKFESHYLNGLIGEYPKEHQRYQDLSPLTHIHKIHSPLILFQGLKDEVVPPSQAEAIVNTLQKNHIPHAYYTFPKEGHGFRQPETLVKVLELELSFFGEILGFIPHNLTNKVDIHC